jgi:nitrite reductase (NADH) small subunit
VLPSGKVREYYDRDNPVVCCPWHGWEYDIKTGRCVADADAHLGVYDVTLENGEVVVDV